MPFWLRVKLGLTQGYMDKADDGTGGGSGGGAPNDDGNDKKIPEGEGVKDSNDDLSGKTPEELAKIIADLKTQKNTLLKETMSRKDLLKQYGDITPERAKELYEAHLKAQAEAEKARLEQEKAAQKELESRGEFEAVKKQMNEQHKKEKEELLKENKTLKEQIENLKSANMNKEIESLFTRSKFLKDEVLLTPIKAKTIYGSHFEINEDGVVVAYDKPKGSATRNPLVDATGDPLGFEDAIAKIVNADPEVDSLLRSKAKPGSGSDSKPKPKVVNNQSGSALDKIALGLGRK